jgi:release factor glutamine methyltransferase
VQSDLLTGDSYDAVVANLPYVARAAELPPEVSVYEPAVALYGGEDGLDVMRRLIAMLGGVSIAVLEVGFDQAGPVAGLVRRAGFNSVERLRDLAGHERVVVGRR